MQIKTPGQIGLGQFESAVLFPEFFTFTFVIFYLDSTSLEIQTINRINHIKVTNKFYFGILIKVANETKSITITVYLLERP